MVKSSYIKVLLIFFIIYYLQLARVARERDYLTKNTTNLHFF